MTAEDAEQMLADLAKHFHEPVMPVSRYCNALRTWRDAVRDAFCTDGGEFDSRFNKLVSAIDIVELAITKSSLLDRLIYWGESLRTRKCPKHQGYWSGLPHSNNDCECGLTGWLPEPKTDDESEKGK